jgi:adenine-specific DNA-methyltransferase
MTIRMEWDGKPEQVDRVRLPFQTVERIDRPRPAGVQDAPSAPNTLVWGDNKLVMSSLLAEYAEAVKLVYLDPPISIGADFSMELQVGDTQLVKQPSIIEEHAYRETWGAGYDSYCSMMYERLILARELLTSDGTIYVHCNWRVSHLLKLLLDEVFGVERFMCQVIWKRPYLRKPLTRRWASTDDVLLVATKSSSYTFNVLYAPYSEEYSKRFNLRDARGAYCWIDIGTYSAERFQKLSSEGRVRLPDRPGTKPRIKHYLKEGKGVLVGSLWTDITPIKLLPEENTGYDYQKPEALARRVIEASSNEGDLIADFFCGSGTTLVAAENLKRRWIGCDLSRFAIHTTRKRLLKNPNCLPFDIKNLGSYERQHWQANTDEGTVREYLNTILALYHAEPTNGFRLLHGHKAGRMVHIGATDAPVTLQEAEEVMDEMAANGVACCDLLGWEWEMGLHDTLPEGARRRGLDVRLRQIPREVMERKVNDAGSVQFFDLAFVDFEVYRQGRAFRAKLTDFVIPNEELIPKEARESIATWSDLVDYWSVDFDYRDPVFHSRWQSCRMRNKSELATESDWCEYPDSGDRVIAVKVVDIFGNDTTKLVRVNIS